MARPVRLLLLFAIASGAIRPGTLAAQAEFAVPVAPGQLRLDITPFWLSYDQRFDPSAPGTLVPLRDAYQSDSFGVAQLPFLGTLQNQLRDATGSSAFTLSLGATQVSLTKSIRTIPVGFELGLTRRLAVGVTVPIVRSRVDATIRADTTAPGTVGWNPGYRTPALVAGFQQQMTDALAALRAQADTGPAALRAQAQALADLLQPFFDVSGAPFLPRTGTTGAGFMTARLDSAEAAYAALAAQFGGVGVTLPALTDTLALPDSTSILRHDDLEQLFSDPNLPLAADTFGTVVRTGIGDVSAHLTYQLADGTHERAQLLLTARFPTGKAPSANDFLDLGTGTHQFGYEAALANDLRLSEHFLLHAVARWGGARSDRLPMRVTSPDLPFAPASALATIERSPATYLGLSLDPVWMLDDAFSVRVLYQYFNRGATRHSYADPADSLRVALPASVLDEGTAMRWMRVGGGVTFSTLDRYIRRQASLPYTLTVSYENTIWGRAGWVPQLSMFRITLRAYVKLFN
jgi:hypothetical protein